MSYRESRLDLDREFRVMPEEVNHYRSEFKPGDIVRVDRHYLGRIIGFNHTWSHIRGGRIVHLYPLVAYPGTPVDPTARPYVDADGKIGAWECDLEQAKPGDVAAHIAGPVGFGYRNMQARLVA